MVGQYPHTATFHGYSDGTQDPDTGDMEPGTHNELEAPCRAEIRTAQDPVKTADGVAINFTWILYLPALSATITPGTKVTVLDASGNPMLEDTVKLALAGTYNARVWL
ncbi:hypothetical protein [Flaviaesturariibacter amylovorans]|uniref:Uncharacterized protein n=1 Tax=Flaviaesturariibacter amylovorans TaxID=1084520 RepID=A0ABP8GRB0_9BACT